MPAQRSIVIGGGALAGLALALALRQGLGADIPIIVADPALGLRPSRDPRATAIVAACRRLFDAIGVWDQVAADAQPILDMVITDSKLEDATRPVFLTFAGNVEPGSTISTDEWAAYGMLAHSPYLHGAVNHRAEEWVRGIHHTQSIEGFWSLLKRSIKGTHVHVSSRHLAKYLAEFEFRYNNRENADIFGEAGPELG